MINCSLGKVDPYGGIPSHMEEPVFRVKAKVSSMSVLPPSGLEPDAGSRLRSR